MRKRSIFANRAAVVLTVMIVAVAATIVDAGTLDYNNLGTVRAPNPETPLLVTEYAAGWVVADLNRDGAVDNATKYDRRGLRTIEAMDYNHDGFMDNFYFYENETLVRQEVDSNFDGRIDLWVYLTDGIYVRGYERDNDHDGTIDMVRLFGD